MQNLRCKRSLGKPLFEMCWFCMGIAQIALDPLPPTIKQANVEKKCLKPSWQALTPLGKRGKKVPQTILASLYTSPLRAIYGNNTFQKGTSLSRKSLLLATIVFAAAATILMASSDLNNCVLQKLISLIDRSG